MVVESDVASSLSHYHDSIKKIFIASFIACGVTSIIAMM